MVVQLPPLVDIGVAKVLFFKKNRKRKKRSNYGWLGRPIIFLVLFLPFDLAEPPPNC
jgi:hypothetical protein